MGDTKQKFSIAQMKGNENRGTSTIEASIHLGRFYELMQPKKLANLSVPKNGKKDHHDG